MLVLFKDQIKVVTENTTGTGLTQICPRGEGLESGLSFRLFNDNSKPVAVISNSAYAWGGMMGIEYLIDPQHQMVTLFYLNMYDREDLYTPFLKQVYKMIDGAE